MDSEKDSPKTLTTRHMCSACFKQYKKKEHLIEHMRDSYHSVHQPKCGVCQKHCKTFESLREHLTGPFSKEKCSRIFADRGCSLCIKIFDSPTSLSKHKEMCRLSAPASLRMTHAKSQVVVSAPNNENCSRGSEVVGIDCEMVGGGSDGSLDLCARVCLIDENEGLIFHTYVQPQIPVTNYRHEVTSITEEHLKNAMPLKEVRERLLHILYNGESIGRVRLDGGKAKLLIGHDLEHDLDCLKMNYPNHLLRDTAKYHPLMKTNLASHSLKYLTRMYLGYDIQLGVHDPFVDCVSAMRLYKRMRSQDHHRKEGLGTLIATRGTRSMMANSFNGRKPKELESMTPDELFQISKSNYRCWCLDSRQELHI